MIPSSLANLLTPGDAKTVLVEVVSSTFSFGSGFSIWVGGFSFFGFSSVGIFSFCVSPVSSIFMRICPGLNSSSAETNISVILPLASAGISIDALSDSSTNIVSSRSTVSPTSTLTSLTVAPSIPSPSSGNKISLIIVFPKSLPGLVFLDLSHISSLHRLLLMCPFFRPALTHE